MGKGATQPSKIKFEKVSQIREKIKDAKSIYFTDFTGLTVSDVTALRRALREAKSNYFVVKNRLAIRALKESDFGSIFKDESQVRDLFSGSTGLAMGFDDPVEPGKILKKTEKIKVKGALIENKVYRGKEYDYFISLPSRLMLLNQLVVSINQPIAGLAFSLNQLINDLVYGLDELRKKKTGGNDVK